MSLCVGQAVRIRKGISWEGEAASGVALMRLRGIQANEIEGRVYQIDARKQYPVTVNFHKVRAVYGLREDMLEVVN